MKLKLLALAAMMAVGGSANAAIDSGAEGNGGLFFNIWDSNRSYTLDLNLTIDAFESAVAAPGSFAAQVFAPDALFTSFLSTANLSSLVWNIVGTDIDGARRVVQTYSTLPATTVRNGIVRTMAGTVEAIASDVNLGLGAGNSAVFRAGLDAGYTGRSDFADTVGGLNNFSNGGTTANNSYASGLNLLSVNGLASGTAFSTYNPYLAGEFAVRAHLGENGTLTISAVPEPETYALMLAGLALMGGIARRRQNKA